MTDKKIKVCESCGVPEHLHQTCCGWDNTVILTDNGTLTGKELEGIWTQLTDIKR